MDLYDGTYELYDDQSELEIGCKCHEPRNCEKFIGKNVLGRFVQTSERYKGYCRMCERNKQDEHQIIIFVENDDLKVMTVFGCTDCWNNRGKWWCQKTDVDTMRLDDYFANCPLYIDQCGAGVFQKADVCSSVGKWCAKKEIKKSVLCFLAIKKFGNESILSRVPRDVLLLIAKLVWSSCDDEVVWARQIRVCKEAFLVDQ